MKKETKKFLKSISFFAIIQPLVFAIIKYLQNNYHTLVLPIDNMISFMPYYVHIYNLFYPFTILSYYYLFKKDEKNFDIGIKAGIISSIIAYIIFLIYPTIMIRPDISNLNIDSITHFILKMTYYYDTPALNCFPSLHCTFCFIIIYMTSISSKINVKNKIFINTLSALIILTTLFIKQHYFLDVISAFIITSIVTLLLKIKSK